MRTVVVFALLALAVSAFDPQAYTQGFIQQFGFDQAQVQDLSTCFIGLSQIINGLKADVQAGDLNSALQTLQGVQAQLATICGAWAEDINQYVAENGNGQQPKQIWEQFAPQIIQQVATWANFLAAGDDLQAGQTEAYIIQILMGAQQPAALDMPQFNFTNYVPFDQDTFFQQYLGAFYDTLGMTQVVNVDEVIECIDTMQGVFRNFTQIPQPTDFDSKLDAIQTALDSVIQGLKSCENVLYVEKLSLIAMRDAFVQDPVAFILRIVDNIATNLPELIVSQQQVSVDVVEGNYTGAGVVEAQRVQTIFAGVFNFAELGN
jgi:hypothetical protein